MRITGTGSALPAREITNEQLCAFVDTSDEWIAGRTGIRSRRVLTDETLLELSVRAAKEALSMAGAPPDSIDMILCSTVRGDYITPGLSCLIQAGIGASCPALDLNGACAGFLYALDAADSRIAAGKSKRVLIVCAEAMSRMADWSDRSTCVLFGDGAAAAVAEAGEGLLSISLTAKGDETLLRMRAPDGNSPFAPQIRAPDYLHMEGQAVYKFAVAHSAEDLRRVVGGAGLTLDAVDHYLLHQANRRIVDAVRARLGQGAEKFPCNIDHTGNTSSASLPILLDEVNRAGGLARGDTVAMSAFGAGLVTAACVLRWNP